MFAREGPTHRTSTVDRNKSNPGLREHSLVEVSILGNDEPEYARVPGARGVWPILTLKANPTIRQRAPAHREASVERQGKTRGAWWDTLWL